MLKNLCYPAAVLCTLVETYSFTQVISIHRATLNQLVEGAPGAMIVFPLSNAVLLLVTITLLACGKTDVRAMIASQSGNKTRHFVTSLLGCLLLVSVNVGVWLYTSWYSGLMDFFRWGTLTGGVMFLVLLLLLSLAWNLWRTLLWLRLRP